MPTTSSVTDTAGTTANNTSKTKKATEGDQLQDRFLSMLVAQMKNQDPLNPMDNAQVTSQMAQLNMVNGITQLNTSFGDFVSQMKASQSLQATNLVGKSAMLPGNALALQNGSAIGGFSLPDAADSATLTIKDADANVIDRIELSDLAKGFNPFVWDGKNSDGVAVADGKYTFEVKAMAQGKAMEDITTLNKSTVVAVQNDANGAKVMDNTGVLHDLTAIAQVF